MIERTRLADDNAKSGDEKALSNASASPLAGALVNGGHQLLARVYYADTDFSGVVYHGRYLEFLERGRTDFLRLTGIHHSELANGVHGEQLVWVVRRMEIDFRAPARIDDILAIETRVEDVSGARIYMRQTISREGVLLIEAGVEAALINSQGRPRRFPKEWKELFQLKVL
ncbi:tol-pal system-associated acyl-CoA thioesterase [Phyllobacterium salinisoli]|uniref:Tol-pal system-associated acyl-CoA thioesterase n=1 Tax=Phyllobacterium salinisoli TaxID=1899321 RepID=A0A368K6N9_9HYPH|nr:tol-pal system-associated acyl-CoA thioesterase [Phyllobacterium salinisoli]RCS23710.1 tol-pal system-associated acyl-CoA thioesterase [Phyllobacterium salinisoli]